MTTFSDWRCHIQVHYFNDVVSVCVRLLSVQNTSSPWLHQAAGSTGDGLGMLSHIPVRPASADANRHSIKMNTHASPPLSKTSMDIHKE